MSEQEKKDPTLTEDLRDVYKSLDKLAKNATDKQIGPLTTKAIDGGKAVLRKLRGKLLTR